MRQVGDVIAALAAARRGVGLYPEAHPAYSAALTALVHAVGAATGDGPLVINWHQGGLYHESVPVPPDVNGSAAVAEAFESHGVESLTLLPAFSQRDALGLTEVLAARPHDEFDVKAELASRSVLGVAVSVLAKEDDPEIEERDRLRQADRALYQRALVALRELQARFSTDGRADLGETPELVSNIMQRLAADPSAVLALATIRGSSEKALLHSLNVMIYALVLGHRLGLPDEGLASLGLSALLHDVGKNAFDMEDPLLADVARLAHPQVGAEILQRVAPEDPAPMLVAYEHHMWADGGGWPERASDYVTHPYSRMVAIADAYENYVYPTDGSDPVTPDQAIVRLLNASTTRLDPLFARLFANALGAFPVGCLVRLSDHSVGVVARLGDDPLAPVVRLAYDAGGNELVDRPDLDLSADGVRILEVIDPEALNVTVADKL
ncbi:MAG TPA: HD domain-containing protein [Coriobacteriia bacterium]|nr:HD domain-containing protein [Coriobacteriia bacterium]